MSSMVTQTQNIWDPIRLGSGVFVHMKSRYQVNGIGVHVISEVNEILNFSEEETIGVIFAFKNIGVLSPQLKDKVDPSQSDVSFSPHQRNSNYLVTSALLDVFQNNNVNVVSLHHVASLKVGKGKDRRSILSPSLDESSESRSSESSDKEYSTPKSLDEPYRFISYINRAGNVYELDGSKENPLPIGKPLDPQGEEIVWNKWLVDYLEDKTRTSDIEFSCAVITKIPDYREKLQECRDEIKARREQLEPYIPPAGRAIFESIQRLEKKAQKYEDILFPVQAQSDVLETGEPSSSGDPTGDSDKSGSSTETETEFQAGTQDIDAAPAPRTEGDTDEGPIPPIEDEEANNPGSGNDSNVSIKLETISEEGESVEEVLEPFDDEEYPGEVQIEPFNEDEETRLQFFSENEFEEREARGTEDTVFTGTEQEEEEEEDVIDIDRTTFKRRHDDDSDGFGTGRLASPKRKI